MIQSGKRSISNVHGLGAQSQKKIYGIDGYHIVHRYAHPRPKETEAPSWKFPKDDKMTYFNHITRSTKGKPGPNKYELKADWKVNQKNFGVGPARTTFTDDAVAHSKKVPSCSQYHPKHHTKLLLGKMEKTEGVNYLSDGQYLAKIQPGPEKYKPNVSEKS